MATTDDEQQGSSKTPPPPDPADPASTSMPRDGRPEDWGSPRIIHRVIAHGDLDRDAVSVIRRLSRRGHTAYLVGGCVRDLLLGRKPKDFDIATSARPRQVKRVFGNCRVIGRRFRLAHVVFGDKIIEVSTFRQGSGGQEAPAEGGDLLIRDDNVFGTPKEDARRRDFTINGLFYDIQQGTVIDYVGGLHDLERKTVRTIGDPDIRFQEDPIRILRAIKFAGRLSLNISPKTAEAIERHRDKIRRSAPPRTQEEILRMARGASGRACFELMRKTAVLEVLLPDVAREIDRRPHLLERYRRYLAMLDTRVASGYEPTTPVIFGLYLMPVVFPESFFSEEERVARPDGAMTEHRIESVLHDLIPRLRLSRRDAGRLRQILMAQRRMAPSVRKRRFSRSSVARQPYFPDALLLFDLHCESLDRWPEERMRWKEAFERVPRPSAPQRRAARGAGRRPAAGEPAGPRKRRPRRRRRRRPHAGGQARPA